MRHTENYQRAIIPRGGSLFYRDIELILSDILNEIQIAFDI